MRIDLNLKSTGGQASAAEVNVLTNALRELLAVQNQVGRGALPAGHHRAAAGAWCG